MKNTTFRKKALLSSVAMLLVAIVALGSATFAWFTANPEVSASGLSMKASTDAGLQICSSSYETANGGKKEFGLSTILNAVAEKDAEGTPTGNIVASTDPKQIATPLSYMQDNADVISFAKATAIEEGKYDVNTTSIDTSGANATHEETIYLKSSIAGDPVIVKSASVKINANAGAGSLASAVRVMLVSGKNVIGIWSTSGETNKYITSAGVVSTTDFTGNKASKEVASTEISVGFTGNDAVKMYVWLDGEDSDCYTTNVNNNLAQLIDSIDVKFSLNSSIDWE